MTELVEVAVLLVAVAAHHVAALLVSVVAHVAVHTSILNNPMKPRLWTAQRRESTA